MKPSPMPNGLAWLAAWSGGLLIAGCASTGAPETIGPPAKEEIVAVSVSNRLMRFNAGQPQVVRDVRALQGLSTGDRVVAIDFRVARGELYALGASGQLYKIDVGRAQAARVGAGAALPPGGSEWGMDFNPTVDRMRIVSDAGANLRLHPDTGAVVDGDPSTPGVQMDGPPAYDGRDVAAGKTPRLVAVAYTYNKTDDKVTTNYALDAAQGTLVHLGTKEGVTPAISPNSGRLYTVGPLGAGDFDHATFDISDLANTAYAALRRAGAAGSRWHRIDLATGRATFIGTIGGGEAVVGAAIEP